MALDREILKVLDELVQTQRAQVELALAKARASIVDEGEAALTGTVTSLTVQARSSNLEIINTVIAYSSSTGSNLNLGRMVLPLPTGITVLSPVRIHLNASDVRSITNPSAVNMALWLFGEEAPTIRFATP